MRRANRLRAPSDFSRTYRTGRRARAGSVIAIASFDEAGVPRVGVTCSKRVANAVGRNRARRRLKAASGPLVESMSLGSVVVLQATPAALTCTWEKLVEDVRVALSSVGALHG